MWLFSLKLRRSICNASMSCSNTSKKYNLKPKPSKCQFFYNEISYLAHHVSQEGIQPRKENLKAVAVFTPPQTYTEIWAFLGLVGHYYQFIKGFAWVAQPLHEHLSGDGTCKKNEWVTLTSDAQAAFDMLLKVCIEAPVLAFADFDKPFLFQTDASELGLGVVLLQKQPDGWYHPVAYASWSWLLISITIILPNKSFWPWSDWSLNSSRNTCTGNHLLWKPTITHLPTFWLLPI